VDLGRQAEGRRGLRRRQLSTDTSVTGGIWSPRYLAVTIANLTVVAVAAFDGLAVVAALPSVGEDLGSIAWLPFVITSYLAASAVAVVVAGPIIDAVGVRRTFRVTASWFCLTTAAAAVAPTMEVLIVVRLAQGLGGGLVIAVALAAVGLAYPHDLRPRAFAANSLVWGLMGFGGPAVAAGLLAFGDWRLVFAAQIPITLGALAAGWRSLPATRDRAGRVDTDWHGVALLTVFVVATLAAVAQLGVRWWVVAVAAAAASVVARTYWSHAGRVSDPVMRREHLVRFPLGAVHLSTAAVLIVGLAADNYLPLYVQTVRGASEQAAAFTLVFLTVGWTLGAIVFSRLPRRWPESRATVAGASTMLPALVLVTVVFAVDGPLWALFVGFSAMGVSIGLVSTSGITWMQRDAVESEMGRVNAAHQFVRTVAITVAVALGGAVLLGTVEARTGAVESVRSLLAGDAAVVDADTVAAIGDGVALISGIAAVLAVPTWVVVWRAHRRRCLKI
jgi:MFS family permease